MNGSRLSNEKRHLTRLFVLSCSKTNTLNNLKIKTKKIITLLLGLFILRFKKKQIIKNLNFFTFFVTRWRVRSAICWNPQFSIQVGPSTGLALNFPGQAWLGSGENLIFFSFLGYWIIFKKDLFELSKRFVDY